MTQCQQRFQQIPGPDLGRYFAHAQAEEERFWRLDGLTDISIPPVVIPVYDSQTDHSDDNADSDGFTDDEDEIEYYRTMERHHTMLTTTVREKNFR